LGTEPASAAHRAPIYALADSQLLFWRTPQGPLFLTGLIERTGVPRPLAVYVGASNGDRPEFYREIFEPAMTAAAPCECRNVLTRPSLHGRDAVEQAHIILLAGGSVEMGWRAFVQTGLEDLILRRFVEGATLIGISAGAVQLGQGGLTDMGSTLLTTFGLLPFYVGAHEEHENWTTLRRALSMAGAPARGVGIRAGGGLIYESGLARPIRNPLDDITIEAQE
jgi:cyanophycinase